MKIFLMTNKCKVTANIAFIVVHKDNCSGRIYCVERSSNEKHHGSRCSLFVFLRIYLFLFPCFLDHLNAF